MMDETQNSKIKIQNSNSKFKNDIIERCIRVSLTIIALSDKLPKKRSAWVIEDQIIRSSTSIGANLVEARSAGSRLEFKRFNEISLRSANETKYWLRLLRELKLVEDEQLGSLLREVCEIANMIASGIIKIKQS